MGELRLIPMDSNICNDSFNTHVYLRCMRVPMGHTTTVLLQEDCFFFLQPHLGNHHYKVFACNAKLRRSTLLIAQKEELKYDVCLHPRRKQHSQEHRLTRVSLAMRENLKDLL